MTRERLLLSPFRWKDGWLDYRIVPRLPHWTRFRWDRDDVPVDRRWGLLNRCLNHPRSDDSPEDIVEFERIVFADGSFEFVEIEETTKRKEEPRNDLRGL